VNLRSLDDLDWPLAWRRVRFWTQQGRPDIADRLPVEALDRLFGDQGPPKLDAARPQLLPVHLVRGSKKGGLARTFARISATDLVLYQALVDALAPDIEAALPPRDRVFQSRQSLDAGDDAFSGTPGRRAYGEAARKILSDEGWLEDRYAIEGDIAGYYASIDLDELERILLEISGKPKVVRDLAALLRGWQSLGVRGLPQGVQPSAPLGNLYLRPLDDALASHDVPWVRWMDDFIATTDSYSDARRLLDTLEGTLYPVGLSLAPAKTGLRRCSWSNPRQETAEERLARLKEGNRASYADWVREATSWTDYPPHQDELLTDAEVDRDTVIASYDELRAKIRSDVFTETSDLIAVLRDLTKVGAATADLTDLPAIVERVPRATSDALEFAVRAARYRPEPVGTAVAAIVQGTTYHRELERIAICAGALRLPRDCIAPLADSFARWAREDRHPLVRARALLVWGFLDRESFATADAFWASASQSWRPYAIVAIQDHERAARDERYARWSAEGGFNAALAREISAKPLGWRKM
jgi:hypothetical protein